MSMPTMNLLFFSFVENYNYFATLSSVKVLRLGIIYDGWQALIKYFFKYPFPQPKILAHDNLCELPKNR